MLYAVSTSCVHSQSNSTKYARAHSIQIDFSHKNTKPSKHVFQLFGHTSLT